MALRTFAKVFKTSYDLAAMVNLVGDSANQLAKLDADRRSTNLASSLGMSEGRLNLERRRVAKQYTKRRKRMDQLMRKFSKQDGELIQRIATIGQTGGTRRGRPEGSKNKTGGSGRGGARPGAGRPKGSKNKTGRGRRRTAAQA